MKIDNKNADFTINNITTNDNFKCLLLYGENKSSVENRYKITTNLFKNKGYEILSIDPDNLKNNENLLVEEFLSISMFAINTLYTLKLNEKENNYTKCLENLFQNNELSNNYNFLIVTCGSLDTSSSLRKYAEKSKYIACIACYEESDKNINAIINKKLKDLDFLFKKEIVEYLSNNIGNNSLIIENEIYKIDLYKGNDRDLSLEDIKTIITDFSNIDLNDFCNSFCDLNIEKTFKILNKIFNEEIELIIIIRMLVRYFLQLQKLRFLIDNGSNIEDVFKNEKIFWKQQISMKNHIKYWALDKINNILEELLEVEKKIKFSQNGKIEFENFLLKYFIKRNKK